VANKNSGLAKALIGWQALFINKNMWPYGFGFIK
jgi:hypothetical protein